VAGNNDRGTVPGRNEPAGQRSITSTVNGKGRKFQTEIRRSTVTVDIRFVPDNDQGAIDAESDNSGDQRKKNIEAVL